MSLHRLFVYGSLLRGEPAHERLEGAAFLGPATTAPGYALIDLGRYPGLLVAPGPGTVVGEVYRVTTAVRDHLDLYEGHPVEFRRLEILLSDASSAEAYAFQGGPSRGVMLPAGDWRKARRGRAR